MTLSNAERQRRYRQRLKERASRTDAAPMTIQEAWDAADAEERRQFMETNELIGSVEQSQLAAEAMRMGADQLRSAYMEAAQAEARRLIDHFEQESTLKPTRNAELMQELQTWAAVYETEDAAPSDQELREIASAAGQRMAHHTMVQQYRDRLAEQASETQAAKAAAEQASKGRKGKRKR